jgi:hypothetical protein
MLMGHVRIHLRIHHIVVSQVVESVLDMATKAGYIRKTMYLLFVLFHAFCTFSFLCVLFFVKK